MPCIQMVAPANTIGTFVQACWKAGHKSNFPQSHGYKKNFLTKMLRAFKSVFIFLTLLFTIIPPPAYRVPSNQYSCACKET